MRHFSNRNTWRCLPPSLVNCFRVVFFLPSQTMNESCNNSLPCSSKLFYKIEKGTIRFQDSKASLHYSLLKRRKSCSKDVSIFKQLSNWKWKFKIPSLKRENRGKSGKSNPNYLRFKANIHSGKLQPVRYGMVRFLLFSEYISCSREEIFSENKRKRTIPYMDIRLYIQ